MAKKKIHVVGFGSQASAWAQCLRTSGWEVLVYTSKKSESFQKATDLGFSPFLVNQLSENLNTDLNNQASRTELLNDHSGNLNDIHWVAMLCPDAEIPKVYDEYIAPFSGSVRLILAHGYAIYSGELQFKKPSHQATLLAPKAIGPKLLQNFKSAYPNPHTLVSALFSPEENREALIQIARDLGFDRTRLVDATFAQETIGDLISEQGLLCGGVFNLLEWTMEAMAKAGIPDALVREECLTELELIAGLIRDRGPAQTFRAISQAAQCGTIAMATRLEEAGFKKNFMNQMESIQNQEFTRFFQSTNWRVKADKMAQNLQSWENRFRKTDQHRE